MIRSLLAGTGMAVVSWASHAADSCALEAARRASQGQFSELAAMFAEPKDSVGLARSLEQLARPLGSIDEVLPLSRQTAGVSARRSVALASLPASYPFEGSWALAITRGGARYEFQASSEPGSSCKLLALHVSRLEGE
jgi:hypothetical protein